MDKRSRKFLKKPVTPSPKSQEYSVSMNYTTLALLFGSLRKCIWMVFLILAQLPVVAQPVVEVLRPNSADRLRPGTTFRIQWRTEGLGTNIDWSIILATNDVQVDWLSSPRIYDGAGNWHTDFTVTSDRPSSCDY